VKGFSLGRAAKGPAFGPVEPGWVRAARAAYYRHRVWLTAIEERITRTEAGMAWLMRVKRIGRIA
jgi:hypothetical protein